ncbi:MAG: LysM peptidoglycan-binding domain-containing protein [Gammaproteobacteria bacterium]|nr:LysM peptidoglycan-binding domain-containing protein [Gammaproteobacteria bacterium]
MITKNFKTFVLISTALIFVGCSGSSEKEETPEPVKATSTTKSDSDYQVERGDNLWAISGKAEVYANPYQWPLIYKNNSHKIKDADLIYPGQVFNIDNNPSSSEVGAAVHHAKTRGRWSIGAVESSDKAYLR